MAKAPDEAALIEAFVKTRGVTQLPPGEAKDALKSKMIAFKHAPKPGKRRRSRYPTRR
jgi:hypothetical protein